MPKKEYEVGYGRPPKEGQFKKGVSGNAAGRPRGKRNVRITFQLIMNEKIQVTEGQKVKMMSRSEAISRQLINKGMSGDLRAMLEVMRLCQTFDATGDLATEESHDASRDKSIMDAFLKELEKMNLESPVQDQTADQKDKEISKKKRPLNVIPGAWEGDDE